MYLYAMNSVVTFLKQVRLFWIVFSAGASAVSVMWYVIRFGDEFTKNWGFCGLDVFFFCLGNYPQEWGDIWIADHYLIVIFPFLILIQQLISYVDVSSCERIYYISFRRAKLWKQALHDFAGSMFIIVSWLFCFELTEEVAFSLLYGPAEHSFFLGRSLNTKEELIFLGCMVIRQAAVLLLIFICVYGMLFKLGLVWSAAAMVGAVAAILLMGFTGMDSPFILNVVSTHMEKPLFILLVMLLIVFSRRKYLKYIYME